MGDLGNFGRLGSLGSQGGLGRPARLGRVALHHARAAGASALAALLPVAYGAVALALSLGSVIGVWPFPDLWPQAWTWQAWNTVADSAALVGSTLALGLTSACAALGCTVMSKVVLCCTTLYCVARGCTVLRKVVLCCTRLY